MKGDPWQMNGLAETTPASMTGGESREAHAMAMRCEGWRQAQVDQMQWGAMEAIAATLPSTASPISHTCEQKPAILDPDVVGV